MQFPSRHLLVQSQRWKQHKISEICPKLAIDMVLMP